MRLLNKLILTILLILISFISLFDLFFRNGHPITFDGHIHMTTMNQFAQSLRDGEFPVTWANNFANFGHPLPIIAHQLPAYFGAFLILLGISTEMSYIYLLAFSIIIATFLFYKFFRKFSSQAVSLAAVVISTFFPYRELNIYTRGGLPELMATIFLPILLLGVWNLQQKKFFKASLLLYFGILGTALTHPMMLIIFLLPVTAYFLYGLRKKNWQKQVAVFITSSFLGILSAAYYLVPLLLEMKYFYQANIEKAISSEVFLNLKQLYDPTWFYTFTHPGPRGNYIKLGTIEFIILVLSILSIVSFVLFRKNISFRQLFNQKKLKDLLFWTGISVLMVLLMLPISKFLYSLPIIYQIQYPWRFLSALQITIPLVFIFLLQFVKKLNNNYVLLVVIALVIWFRVPQFYGKNYVIQPESDYYFNQANLHSTNFNTIWSSNSEDYEVKTVQAQIIAGVGELKVIEQKNASRVYQTNSNEELRLIDYTFYFPGWTVYVDGKPTEIEFQDLNYRGLITYRVPAGSHQIKVSYEHTKTRLFGLLASGVGLVFSACYLFIIRKQQNKYA